MNATPLSASLDLPLATWQTRLFTVAEVFIPQNRFNDGKPIRAVLAANRNILTAVQREEPWVSHETWDRLLPKPFRPHHHDHHISVNRLVGQREAVFLRCHRRRHCLERAEGVREVLDTE